jgi:hypothetical protein
LICGGGKAVNGKNKQENWLLWSNVQASKAAFRYEWCDMQRGATGYVAPRNV